MSRETFQSLRMLLMEKLDLARELTDEEILEEIDTLILERMWDSCLSLKEKVQLRQELFHSVRKLDVLQELIEDETVTEIMVNGPDAIFVERAGKLSRWEKTFTSGEKLEDVIQQIVGKCNRVVNESMPIVDARLDNGARVNAVIRPVALNGPILTIRRFPDTPITNGKADRTWKSAVGMCRISCSTCAGAIFDGNRRRNGEVERRRFLVRCPITFRR